MDHSTTIWFASSSKKPSTNQGMKPFGWVSLILLSRDDGLRALHESEQLKSIVFDGKRRTIDIRKKYEQVICDKILNTDNASKQKMDPEIELKAAVERFRKALPDASQLTGKTEGLIQRIRSMQDLELRKGCAKALLDCALMSKKKFKKAKKEGKPWVKGILELCNELGITVED